MVINKISIRTLVCRVTFVHLERGTATSEHKIRNNRRWFSSFKFLALQPESWAASKCYSAVYLIFGLMKTQIVGFVWKVLLLRQLCDGDPSSRLVGQHKCRRIRHPRADRRQWKVGGWTQPTKFLAKLHLRIGFNMHNAPCKSIEHRLYWTLSRVHRPAKGSLMPACLSSLIHAKEDCSIVYENGAGLNLVISQSILSLSFVVVYSYDYL